MNKYSFRFFDVIFSLLGLILFLPLMGLIAVIIRIDSGGGIFYKQQRVGKDNRDFFLWKFRTMKTNADQQGLLTVGKSDVRITGVGRLLRRFKLDELPQFINVLKGEMSLVGPRPEVRKYVDLYTPAQLKILSVKPGITDFASVEYIHENEILGNSQNPDKTYVEEIMPKKISLNMEFINEPTLINYFRILGKTIYKIVSN